MCERACDPPTLQYPLFLLVRQFSTGVKLRPNLSSPFFQSVVSLPYSTALTPPLWRLPSFITISDAMRSASTAVGAFLDPPMLLGERRSGAEDRGQHHLQIRFTS